MSDGIRYLEFLSRHGLDARVLQEYKQCGMLYCSKRWKESADIHRFVDFEGVNRNVIKKVDELEYNLNIIPFHIIENNEDEIIIMYCDPDIDKEFQFKEFKTGKCSAIKYTIKDDYWVYTELNYEVRLGSVVDVDFDVNM